MEKAQVLIANEQFLQRLSGKLRHKHLLQKSTELEDVKLRWYVAMVLYTAARETSDEYDMSRLNPVSDSTTDEVMESLKDRLTQAECEHLVQSLSQKGQSSLLDIQTPYSAPPKQELIAEFKKIINEHARKKLIDVSQFFQPSPVTAGSNLLNAKASQFHNVIVREINQVETNGKEIEVLRYQRMQQIRKLYEVHGRNLQSFETLVVSYKLSTLPESEAQTSHHLAAKTDALTAKIGLIEKELLADTYKPSHVKELSSIRKQLDAKLAATSQCLDQVELEYRSCLSAGADFQRIAEDYARLKRDIEARVWALNEYTTARQHKT